jgi:iron complex transport system substrate-binding protein
MRGAPSYQTPRSRRIARGVIVRRQPRIVSLIASATEIVCALGFRDRLVGRSHECDFPDDVLELPALTAPKFKVEGTSAEIDARVREIVRDGLSVYRVDGEALKALEPDVIVTQDHCEVCAVSLSDVEDGAAGRDRVAQA